MTSRLLSAAACRLALVACVLLPFSAGSASAHVPPARPRILDPAPPNAPPRIVRIWISQTTVHGGDVVHAHIRTTSNVASVEVRVANRGISLPRDDYGSFTLDYTVPSLPFFFHGQHAVQVIARNAAGVAVSQWLMFNLE